MVRFKFLYKWCKVGKVPAYLVINLENLLSLKPIISWENYKIYSDTIVKAVQDGTLGKQ